MEPPNTSSGRLGKAVAVAAAVAITSFAFPAGAEPAPSLEPIACDESLGLPPDARCGEVPVFENRATGVGRVLRLHVVTLPATGEADESRPPMFFLAGGPGDATSHSAAPIGSLLAELRPSRDLVFVDIRGTGRSAPLYCQPLGPVDALQTYMEYLPGLDDVASCKEQLETKADLTQYTTSYAADDLNDVRAALGHERMALLGGSYGTRLAQEVIRRHPDRVELAVLIAVAPPSMTAPSGFARAQQRALDRLVELCSADPACRTAHPDFPERLARVLERAAKSPVEAMVEHPAFDAPQAVRLDRDELAMGLRFLAYQAESAAGFPAWIARADEGDFTPLLTPIALAYYDIGTNFYRGLYYSMTCTEDLPFVDLERERKSSAGTVLGMFRMQRQLDTCEIWPRGEADPALHEPLASDVPVLLISGEIDPVTPPSYGDLVARTLSRSLHMVLAHRGHGAVDQAALACWLPAVVEFARTSSLDGVDIGCAARLEPLPFSFEAG